MIPFSVDIRQTFFNFFQNRGHIYVPQSSIMQPDDPSIMFTNSGMIQFKDIFLGNKKISEKRLVNSQLCLRVSGKHNDLDEVGVDTYHHTMFEMLGNWSIGDFFKKEIIEWSYELLTEYYNIDKNRIYVTVFAGDRGDGLEEDKEAYNFWRKIVPEDHIVYGDKSDNFWEMGEVGPCGPCSEIHIDLRDDTSQIPGRELVNKGNPEIIEIWNLVFMQYERMKDGSLRMLSDHYVDTGMGFERLVRILQGKKSNYDTDIFSPYLVNISNFSKKKYGVNEKVDIAMRVIADHIRAVVIAICDGCIPSNVKEGYVIRRILRRAIRYGYSFLGFQEPMLYRFTKIVALQYLDIKPEIQQKLLYIENIIKTEEEDFLRTISLGIRRINDIIKNNSKPVIDGHIVFELYDTFGFPADLTDIILKENNLSYDKKSYDEALARQKQRSRAASTMDMECNWTMINEEKQNFVGYDTFETKTKILGYRTIIDKDKNFYHIILKDDPFYGESGGQVGDTGTITYETEEIKVIDTKKNFGLIYIITESLPKNIHGEVIAKIDSERRKKITIHHSATHLLQATLKKILGDEVEQRGSYVCDKYLRFDFACTDNLIGEKKFNIEKLLNEKIREEIPSTIMLDVNIEDARKMMALCLFENKYGDKVRIIKFGDYSIELCGGSHVKNSKDIVAFKITNIKAIARGIKRIEAIAGYEVFNFYEENLKKLNEIGVMLVNKVNPVQATKDLIDDNFMKEALLGVYRQETIKNVIDDLIKKVEIVKDRKFIFGNLDLAEPNLAKVIVKNILDKIEAIVILTTQNNEGIFTHVGSSYPDIAANDLVKKITGNDSNVKGGGNALMAMMKSQKNISKLYEMIKQCI